MLPKNLPQKFIFLLLDENKEGQKMRYSKFIICADLVCAVAAVAFFKSVQFTEKHL